MVYWARPGDVAAARPDWVAVAIFFVVACAWSAVAAHWGAVQFPADYAGLRVDNGILAGFGPAVGGLVAGTVRPGARRARSLLGLRPAWIVLAIAAPVLTMAAFGALRHIGPADRHLSGAVFAASVVIYCVGEELGWRGWLYDALAGLKLWQSALLTGILWYAWHWTFLAETLREPRSGIGFAVGLVIGSFGLAAAVRRTRATGIAVAWHAAVKTLGLPAQIVAMVATIALANWAAGRGPKASS